MSSPTDDHGPAPRLQPDVLIGPGTPQIGVGIDSEVAWISLNNPSKHNALTLEMLTGLASLALQLEQTADIAVIVLQGTGGQAFAAGVDLAGATGQAGTAGPLASHDAAFRQALLAWRAITKPVIAMVSGYCIGGGLSLALEADMRLCCQHSQFAVPAVRLGLGYPDVAPLVQCVGAAWAAEILLSGRRLSSQEALASGLVNRVTPCDNLLEATHDLAAMIAANAPLALKAAKVAIRDLLRAESERDPAFVRSLVDACARSEDLVEGTAALREHRPPRFRGR
jgi:enoyl-CoA hydratase